MERSLGHRAPLLWLLVPWMAGIALGRLLPPGIPVWIWAPFAVVGGGVAWHAQRRVEPGRGAWRWGTGLALALLAAGLGYFQWREARLPTWDRLPPREAELELSIERVFPPSPGRATTGGFAIVENTPALLRELRGQRVYFSLRGERAWLTRSARVRAEAVLAALPRRPAEGFDAYLAASGAGFKFTRGRVLARTTEPTAFFQFCEVAAVRFEQCLGQGLATQPRLRSVLVAMLLGRKAELSEEQQAVFMQSGTMHLFAISGLHVVVIWGALAALLAVARVPKLLAAAIGLAALYLYVQITGGAPSAMRAFIMIAFVIAGRLGRWPHNAVASIAAAATFTLVMDPHQLFGAGFQMSYSVVTALLWYGLPLDETWQQRWQPWRDLPEVTWTWWQRLIRWGGHGLLSATALCVAATAINAPTSIELFHLFTPGALLANLVLIPLGSVVLFAGVASLAAGLCGLESLAVLFNHAGIVAIWVMEQLAGGSVKLPAMFWAAEFRWGWGGSVTLVLLLVAVAWGYARQWGKGTGGLWTPIALLTFVLLVGVRWGGGGRVDVKSASVETPPVQSPGELNR